MRILSTSKGAIKLREWRKEHPDIVREISARRSEHLKNWRAQNPEKTAMYYKKRIESGEVSRRPLGGHLKSVFGITRSEYAVMYSAQDGKCAVCGETEKSVYKGKIRSLSVDHDHATGKVRALLCNRCNVGIGRLGDSSTLLRAAADYLDAHAGMEKVASLEIVA